MKNIPLTNGPQAPIENLLQQLAEEALQESPTSSAELQTYLQAGFSTLLRAALLKERELYLQQHPEDRANGYAPPRQLKIKTTPVSLERPRTRGGFYPIFLPKHQRQVPEDYQELLEQILLESKSFESALRTMQAIGAGYSRQQLEALLGELEKEAQAFHQRPLEPDWLIVYLDAKELDLKDEHDQIKKAVLFLVLGVDFEGRKQILCFKTFWGQETLETWRQVFIELKNRGLTRILLLVTDDFSGLLSLVDSFWPNTDHQLCTVHLLRNAHRQLSPQDYRLFQEAWQEILAASSPEAARTRWLALLDTLRAEYPTWTAYLQARTDRYLAFMKYPSILRRHLRSTNLPEGINNLIETVRRNAGGHFHTPRELAIKMKILADRLIQRKWAKPHPMILHHRATLIRMFKLRFEAELPSDHFLTQNF